MKLLYFLSIILTCIGVHAQEISQLSQANPLAVADLRTTKGAATLNARWFVQPAHIDAVNFRSPGPGVNDALLLYPTGMNIQSSLLQPQAGAQNFHKNFTVLQPEDLEKRQGAGLTSFVWYKAELEIPSTVGKVNTSGTVAVFEIVVDDYSEIWVNGKQKRSFGQTGEGLISGYNARNRVVLTDSAVAGEKFSILVLGMNGPVGQVPENYIWVRSAVVDFYDAKKYLSANNIGQIHRVDSRLDKIIAQESRVEKIAAGFQFTEGPVWHPDGFLLFSDPNANNVYRYDPGTHNVSVYISHSGYTGTDIGEYSQPGSNGLAIDKEGRLVVCQHGNRRVIRHELKGPITVLADKIDDRRLNSPNDLVLKSDGTIYFTDPPYGLPSNYNDPRKELAVQGVYMIKNGKVKLVAKDCGGPNGIAFSPDEKYLYVTNWDIRDIHRTKTIWRYEVLEDGSLSKGVEFYNMNQTEDEEALDGIKVDRQGNLFVSAPGGLWIISASGELLGKIVTPERPANMAWGDADGKTLYLTAHSSIYRLRVQTGGKFSWQ